MEECEDHKSLAVVRAKIKGLEGSIDDMPGKGGEREQLTCEESVAVLGSRTGVQHWDWQRIRD